MKIVDLDNWPGDSFPDPETALDEPNGLLAVGGDLEPQRLLAAYRQGIFPWHGPEDPILWWSPDPRAVFIPGRIHCARRLRRKLRTTTYLGTIDHCFAEVVKRCAAARTNATGSWLHAPMQTAYNKLHLLGHAHSVEIWDAHEQLAGGLYGVVSGRVFFAESMFSSQRDGSKIALLYLGQWLLQQDFKLIDAQIMTPHLQSMGALAWSRQKFLQALGEWTN